MFNKRLFKAQVILKGKTMREVSRELGIDEATLYRKMNGKSDFFRSEIQILCQFLAIESPTEIFFTDDIAQTQKEGETQCAARPYISRNA